MELVGVHSFGTTLSISPLQPTRTVPLVKALAPPRFSITTNATKKGTVFPVDGPVQVLKDNESSPIKLLTNVEKLRLLSKAEKAGLLSAAENLGFSLSSVERLGLLSKAEELGVLSAATDPETPNSLLVLSLILLGVGPLCVYVVPETYPWEIALQAVVALVSVVGGSTAFAASSFVSKLQSN